MNEDNFDKRQGEAEPDTTRSEDTQLESMEPVAPMQPDKPMNKKSKKPLIIGVVIAAAVVVLGGGSALAYNMWYQNPDKVLSDAVSNLVSRDSLAGKGELKVSDDEYDGTVDVSHMILDGKASFTVNMNIDYKKEDMKLDIAGNAVYEKDGTVYIKVNNAQKLFDSMIDSQIEKDKTMSASEKAMAKGMAQAMFGSVIKEIDGQWIKISSKDISDKEDSSDDMKCLAEATDMISNDKDARNEIKSVYMDNKFMVVKDKLGSKDGNIGFVYKFDQTKVKDFEKAVEETKLGKKIAECDTSSSDKTDDTKADESELDNVSVEIWVDRWTHDLAKLHVTSEGGSDGDVQMDYTPDYETEVTSIETPKDAITLDELSKRMGNMFNL